MSDIEERRESWRTKAREVAKNVVAPRAAEIDAEGEFAWDLAEAYSKHGFLSLLIPKEYGGMDADVTLLSAWSPKRSPMSAPLLPSS